MKTIILESLIRNAQTYDLKEIFLNEDQAGRVAEIAVEIINGSIKQFLKNDEECFYALLLALRITPEKPLEIIKNSTFTKEQLKYLLLKTAQENRVDILETLFEKLDVSSQSFKSYFIGRASADVKDAKGKTALHYAAEAGHVDVVQALLKRTDTYVNAQDKEGNSALHYAAAAGHEDVVKVLLGRVDIDINVQDKDGVRALHYAALKGHKDVVQAFLERTDTDVNAQDKEGLTALHRAALKGHVDVVQAFLERTDTDVNAQDKDGNSALHYAAAAGHEDVVKVLLGRVDIDINVQDKDGLIPLHQAAVEGYVNVVRVLLERVDIKVNAQDKDGNSALHYAAAAGRAEIVQALLAKRETEVNLRGKSGRTALHHAVEAGEAAVVVALMERAEIDVCVVDKKDLDPLDLAVKKNNLKLLETIFDFVLGNGHLKLLRNNFGLVEKLDELKQSFPSLQSQFDRVKRDYPEIEKISRLEIIPLTPEKVPEAPEVDLKELYGMAKKLDKKKLKEACEKASQKEDLLPFQVSTDYIPNSLLPLPDDLLEQPLVVIKSYVKNFEERFPDIGFPSQENHTEEFEKAYEDLSIYLKNIIVLLKDKDNETKLENFAKLVVAAAHCGTRRMEAAKVIYFSLASNSNLTNNIQNNVRLFMLEFFEKEEKKYLVEKDMARIKNVHVDNFRNLVLSKLGLVSSIGVIETDMHRYRGDAQELADRILAQATPLKLLSYFIKKASKNKNVADEIQQWILAHVEKDFNPYSEEAIAAIRQVKGFEKITKEEIKKHPSFTEKQIYNITRHDTEGNFIYKPKDLVRLLKDYGVVR